MIKRGYRECILCGSQYKYCPRCGQDEDKPKWMVDFDDENCKIIFDTVSAYVNKRMDAKNAKNILSGCNLETEKYSEVTRKFIKEIMDYKEEVVVAKTEVSKAVEYGKTYLKNSNNQYRKDSKKRVR